MECIAAAWQLRQNRKIYFKKHTSIQVGSQRRRFNKKPKPKDNRMKELLYNKGKSRMDDVIGLMHYMYISEMV